MAWLVLSNAVSTQPLWSSNENDKEEEEELWIQGCIRFMSDPASSVRQAATAFSYNAILLLQQSSSSTSQQQQRAPDNNDSLTDTQVSLLCATLESLGTETDPTARLRRIMTSGRILVPGQRPLATAMELVINLGLHESIQQQARAPAENNGTDADTGRRLALELDQLLSFYTQSRS